jgi:hypothetical protein
MKTFTVILLAITFFYVGAGLTHATGGRVAIVPEPNLENFWREEKAGIAYLEIGGRFSWRYGCANVGFIIESNGKISTPLRILDYRVDRKLPARDRSIQVMFSSIASAIPTYAPVTRGDNPVATFTSLSVPFVQAKFAKSLTAEQILGLTRALRHSCLITDLATRLTSADKAPQQLDPLPGLEQLLLQAGE